jgi:1-acyl-sn-glycerol-3-phosphate acyltransferase
VLRSLWSWLALAALSIFGFCVQALLAVFTFPFDRRRYVCGRWFRLIGVSVSRAVPSWRFRVHGTPPRSINGRTVVISNHASHADTMLISQLPWEMKWMAKRSLLSIPFVGWMMWLAGDVPVDRGEKESAIEAMRRCVRWLDRGMPVMIFPEGTRSPDGNMLPFKDGAFRLAIEAGAELLPLAVYGTSEALPKHSWRFGTAEARVAVGKPISTAGLSLDRLPELKAQARAQIEALVAEMQASARPSGKP